MKPRSGVNLPLPAALTLVAHRALRVPARPPARLFSMAMMPPLPGLRRHFASSSFALVRSGLLLASGGRRRSRRRPPENEIGGAASLMAHVSRRWRGTVPAWIEPRGTDTGLKLYNTLTRSRQKLILTWDDIATWYLCGPTVYDSAHLGHASTYVRFDILRRIFADYFGIDVLLVMSITDIDDKIIMRAKEAGTDTITLARHYESEFFKDMASLNVLPPTYASRVTEHMQQIIKFIEKLTKTKDAYITPTGCVYFDVNHYGRYGCFRQYTPSDEQTIVVNPEKKQAEDFALWKASKTDEPWWESPWGKGRPGWHIECSAMASKVFGENLDIHSGGEDLIFPHHENEIAQSQAYYGCRQWANYWVHTGHLYQKDSMEKMSKSLKNVISISELLEDFTADQFRLFCLLTHYRRRIEFSKEAMQKAVKLLKQFTNCIQLSNAYIKGQLTKCPPISEADYLTRLNSTKQLVREALHDDIDTPKVMETITELMQQLNATLTTKSNIAGSRSPVTIASVSIYLQKILHTLGLDVNQKKLSADRFHQQCTLHQILNSAIEFRHKVRQFALHSHEELFIGEASEHLSKKEKMQQQLKVMQPLLSGCDDFRKKLEVINIQIQDHGETTVWQLAQEQHKRKK